MRRAKTGFLLFLNIVSGLPSCLPGGENMNFFGLGGDSWLCQDLPGNDLLSPPIFTPSSIMIKLKALSSQSVSQ